ncbi:3-deoxy-D-manno-octulosonic acid transferase [Alteromonas sp. 1_MG-2023]|nr:3-deoxy-D-manno-octulosonic acid transferase [Alteromonas sp. 1_MG-2023]MDO6567788.1 3-deoxy-D-manno-octulosonic acid transferase [Alteromonas sp. 1_MG-2023]
MKASDEKTSRATTSYKPSLVENICRWLYSFVFFIIIPIAFLNLARRGATRNKEYSQRRFERFGFVARPPKTGGYLFHCVSVGEVVAASCLIKQIMQTEPNTQITVTTTTPTGSARVRDIFGNTVHHFYLPYDLHTAMAKMIKRIKPKAVLITEVELWPNFIHACWKRDIPIMVINARMTDRSAKRYLKISKLFRPMLNKLTHICTQGQRDYNNYLMLGMPEARMTQTNNIKFDQAASTTQHSQGFLGLSTLDGPIFVAGSTHDLEEQAMIDAVKTVWSSTAVNLRLIIVPRHPERFDTVAKLLQQNKLNYVRTSEVDAVSSHSKVILLDEMGKLNSAYSIASFAFVGGSIANRGGHNALEPAAFSIPVMMGPNTYNNPVICEYLEERGALTIVSNAQDIAARCEAWINDNDKLVKAGKAGRKVLEENSGALDKTLTVIKHNVRESLV